MKKFFVSALAVLMLFVFVSCGIKPEDDRVVMTLDGEKIHYDYFRYVFLNSRDDLAYGQPDGYWKDNSEAQKKLEDAVIETLLRNKAIMLLADEYDMSLTKSEKDDILDYIKKSKKNLGGSEPFKESLAASYLTEYSFKHIQEIMTVWTKLYNHITSETSGVIKCGDEIILADVPKNFRNIKYIMISNDEKDDKAENFELAKNVQSLAASGEDFDELIKEHGEDNTMEQKLKNGYYFTIGSVDETIEEAVLELEENQVSEVIDMGYAYYIVKRVPIDLDYVEDNLDEFRRTYCARIFNEMLNEKASEIEVDYKDLYNELTVFTVE